MIDYRAKVEGANRVALRFERFPTLAHDGLARYIAGITDETAAGVLALVPKGKTGKLAGQVQHGLDDSNDRVRGWISLSVDDANAVEKAAALEFGSRSAKFQVKAYSRTLDQVFGHIAAPFQQAVAAYQRAGTLPKLDFLHGPFRDRGSGALDGMNAAVERAIKETENA
jgi:hypothetical protein